ncbi:MAG: nudix-type nucleoside diphosphatase (YffH/AdpP family) [Polaribacter sp.]|jgi:nudix-type nucleoside diphosphatase (YffH/AdpP family)
MRKVNIEKTNRILDDFFKVDEAFLQFEKMDGDMSETVRRLNFERGDGVAALVFNEDTDRIILVRQFRYATHLKGESWVIETVAGMKGADEDPEEAIIREIEEEIGYANAQLTTINNFFVSPGGTSERIYLYYAVVSNMHKVSEGGGLASEAEDIQILEYHFEELMELMENEVITDAKTLIALLWLENLILKQ